MGERSAVERASLVYSDLRTNRGRRVIHGLTWRARRVRDWALSQGAFAHGPAMYSVAFGPNGDRVLDAVRAHAKAYGITPMFGGSLQPWARTVHVGEESLEALCRCVLEQCPELTIYVRHTGQKWRDFSVDAVENAVALGDSVDLMVLEHRIGVDPPHLQCSRIEIAVWTERSGAYGTRYRESDRIFPIVARLRTVTYKRLTDAGHDFDDDYPTPAQPTFPVDVVYTWVDGDDEAWQEQKERYSPKGPGEVAPRVLLDERFRSRDELKYSLRSLELFAPWVRRIHIVTADQCPSWLDVSHPKINMVSHKDVYADPAWLPTFNSSSIETQLHHVPGLATKFLYFNDDFFLGQFCSPSDFFYSNGMVKFFPTDQRAFEGDIDHTSEEYIQADKNAIEMFQEIMPAVGRTITCHVPYPSDRDLLSEMEDRWPEEFAACGSARFRSSADLRPIAFMQYHYGYEERRAVPASISHRYLALWKPNIIEQLDAVGRRRSYKTFCINDVGLEPHRTAEVNEAVVAFLDAYFPQPSSFER